MRRKRKPKLTMKQRLAFYERTVTSLEKQLAQAQHKLSGYEREEECRERDKRENWRDYDRAADAVTANERALFEASPAYKKYLQFRQTKHLVQRGDWRAP